MKSVLAPHRRKVPGGANVRETMLLIFCFLSVSTIGGGGDATIPSLGTSRKQPIPGTRLHDPLHGRQACPEISLFYQGVCKISQHEGLFPCRPVQKWGQYFYIPAPSPIVRRLFFLSRLYNNPLCRRRAIDNNIGTPLIGSLV